MLKMILNNTNIQNSVRVALPEKSQYCFRHFKYQFIIYSMGQKVNIRDASDLPLLIRRFSFFLQIYIILQLPPPPLTFFNFKNSNSINSAIAHAASICIYNVVQIVAYGKLMFFLTDYSKLKRLAKKHTRIYRKSCIIIQKREKKRIFALKKDKCTLSQVMMCCIHSAKSISE